MRRITPEGYRRLSGRRTRRWYRPAAAGGTAWTPWVRRVLAAGGEPRWDRPPGCYTPPVPDGYGDVPGLSEASDRA